MEITVKNGKSYIREIALEDIASQYGTPFYFYDLNCIEEKIKEFRNNFGNSIKLYYAIKANSNIEILRAIRDKVDGLDISSYGEMEQCILAGYQPQQLSFAGPGKTCEELEKAIRNEIGIISVESLREMEDIKKISIHLGMKVNIVLRVNPILFIKEFAIKMGGQATQFGIDEEEIGAAVDYLRKNSGHFNLKGIHVYSGTQCMDAEPIVKNIRNILEIAKDLRMKYEIKSSFINLGGGFGASYYDNQKLDIGIIAEGVKKAIEDYKKITSENPCFILELGRYLVTEAGIYVARVVSSKESRGKLYFVLDGGMNHHLAASGNFGVALRKNFIFKNLSNPNGEIVKCNLVGPLCTTLDLMGRDVTVESPRIGDLIALLNSGSYGFTASPIFFLGHDTPLELLAFNNDIKIIRKRKKMAELN